MVVSIEFVYSNRAREACSGAHCCLNLAGCRLYVVCCHCCEFCCPCHLPVGKIHSELHSSIMVSYLRKSLFVLFPEILNKFVTCCKKLRCINRSLRRLDRPESFSVVLYQSYFISWFSCFRKARKDRIAAANLPPAPKKPIWRPKPKKKNRKNKNKW